MLHRKIKIVFKFLKLLIVDTAPSPDHESISGYPVKENLSKMLSTDAMFTSHLETLIEYVHH